MMQKTVAMRKTLLFFLFLILPLSSCEAVSGIPNGRVIAVETFLADIAGRVAGDRLEVSALLPYGTDPHGYQPAPQDLARIADCALLLINGGGVEGWLEDALRSVAEKKTVVSASEGLAFRTPKEGEPLHPHDLDDEHETEGGSLVLGHEADGDPHFWMDPILVIHYVERIRGAFTELDPDGASVYAQNAEAYIAELRDLDGWVRAQVDPIPANRRLLVTNHHSLGYFADRYGFRVIGTVLPGVDSAAAPSARQMAGLIDSIRATGAPAIFLEEEANLQLARQIAAETGVQVVDGLRIHSISDRDGQAPTYLELIRWNVNLIVDALR